MLKFHATILFLSFRLISSSLKDALSEAPIAFQQIKTKDEIVLKVAQQEEHPEYPGNNVENLKRVNDNWDKYYECQNNKLEHEKERKPILVQIMEGQYISMKCPHCIRPFQDTENLKWKYKPLSSDIDDPDEPQLLDLASQMRLTHKMTLKIYNAIKGYSGLYVCYNGNYPVSVYILEVVEDQQIMRFHPLTQPLLVSSYYEVYFVVNVQLTTQFDRPHEMAQKQLNEEPLVNDSIKLPDGNHLEVYYLWSKWTECSACDTIGKKYKYGICMAKLEQSPYISMKRVLPGYFSGRRRFKKLRIYSKKSKKRQESVLTPQPDAEETKTMKQLINKFQNGIPCTSYIMPILYGSLIKNLNKTPSAAIVEYCKIDCPESSLFEVMDHNGKVLEIANNSAGIYSSLQAIPQTPPEVERRTITAEFGEDIIIQCPGNMNTDTPITWMIENQILIPEIISNESNGRIFIDLLNRLHINHLRLKDAHVYSCWQRNILAGTVTLDVDKKLNISYDHHMMLLSMLSIAVTFLYIGIKILTRELKMRKK